MIGLPSIEKDGDLYTLRLPENAVATILSKVEVLALAAQLVYLVRDDDLFMKLLHEARET